MSSLEEQLEETAIKIAFNIKKAMLEKNMTQAELAKKLNVDRSQLNRAIQGDNSRRSRELRETIYQYLGMNGGI